MKTTLKILIISFIFFAAISSAKASILSTPGNNLGLVAYYPFEDATSTIATDHSGNGNIAAISVGTSTLGWVDGRRGKALDFDGADDTALISDFPISATMTTSAWVKLDSVGVWHTIIGVCDDQNSACSGSDYKAYLLRINTSNNLAIFVSYAYSTADRYVFNGTTTTFEAGKWYHIVLVTDTATDTVTAYVNNELESLTQVVKDASGAGGFTTDIGLGVTLVTYDDTYGNTIDGQLDEVRIYNRVLGTSEISKLYTLGAKTISASNRKNLVAYWPFEDGEFSTSTTDHSGNGHTGTLTNMTKQGGIFGSSDWVDGKRGVALDFDGSNDYIDVNSIVGDINSSQAGSISYWIYYRGTKGDGDNYKVFAVTDGDSTNNYLYTGIHSGDVYAKIKTDSTRWDLRTDAQINNNQWYHVVIVHDGSEASIYLNGEKPSQTFDTSTDKTSWAGDLSGLSHGRIGDYYVGSSESGHINAQIDEVRVYNVALSAAEISSIYNQGIVRIQTVSKKDLSLYYPFEDAISTKATDHSGNGNTGTLTDMTDADWVDGKKGKALDFDGSDDYVNTSFGPSYGATDSFSIALWAKADTLVSSELMIGAIEESGNDALVQFVLDNGESCATTGALMLSMRDTDSTASDYICSAEAYDDDKWHHYVGIFNYSSDQIQVYIDGVSSYNTSITTNSDGIKDFSSYPYYIGARNNRGTADAFFKGQIDEVRVYKRVLSGYEIEALYNLDRAKSSGIILL